LPKRFDVPAALGVCVLALMLAGCGSPALGATGPALHVTRTGFGLPALDVTVTNAAQVRRLFDAALALRNVPEGAMFACPADWGTRYHLTFTAHDSAPVEMTLDASGCRFLFVEPSGPSYFQTDAFRALFSEVTGITPIEPQQPPG
jgi:hypothetical protein